MGKKLKHGGDIRQMSEQFQIPLLQWLDLSTCVSPYHYPVNNIPAAVFHCLPDNASGLLKAAQAYYQCDDMIACSGSQQAIQWLPKIFAPIPVALPDAGYQEHAYRWQQAGHTPHWYDGYCPEQIERLIVEEAVEAALLINPNNPTATIVDVDKILHWADLLAARGGVLIIDEAFIDLTPQRSVVAYCGRPGLIVLRSIGMFFGLAGIRAGFVMGESSLLRLMEAESSPWQVSGPAEYLTIAALNDEAWQRQQRLKIAASKRSMVRLLAKFFPQQFDDGGLFLSIKVEHKTAYAVYQALAEQGIAIRLGIYSSQWAFLRFGLISSECSRDYRRLEKALRKVSVLTEMNNIVMQPIR